jgi:putative ATPase
MKQIGYGKDYSYAHDFENNFIHQDYLPAEIKDQVLYSPQANPREEADRKRLRELWKKKYGY